MSPSTTSTDREDAIRALTWYIRRRDQTPAAERADDDIEAGEMVQALMLRGWRRTAARPALPWQPDPGGERADPDTVRQRAAEARAGLNRTAPASTQENDQ